MANQVVWFDVPALDIDRAIRFYTAVLAVEIKKEVHGEMAMGVLPHANDDVAGCIFTGHGATPGKDGPLLYFNCQGRLDDAITAAESKGGKILQPKHPIGPYGYRALVLDSEGNRIALHSM